LLPFYIIIIIIKIIFLFKKGYTLITYNNNHIYLISTETEKLF
jgi:hypothetical protein